MFAVFHHSKSRAYINIRVHYNCPGCVSYQLVEFSTLCPCVTMCIVCMKLTNDQSKSVNMVTIAIISCSSIHWCEYVTYV